MAFDKHEQAQASMYKKRTDSPYGAGSGSMESAANIAVDVATIPSPRTVAERAQYVIINNVNQSYAFLYQTTSSKGGTVGVGTDDNTHWITGSGAAGAASGPVRLDIQPIAWDKVASGGSAGDVTFVIKKTAH